MVVDRDGQHLLGPILADDVLVEPLHDLLGGRQVLQHRCPFGRGLRQLLAYDLVTEIDADVTDKHIVWPLDQAADFLFDAMAKRATGGGRCL